MKATDSARMLLRVQEMVLERKFAPKQTHWRLGPIPDGRQMPQQAMCMFQISGDDWYPQMDAASDENARNVD